MFILQDTTWIYRGSGLIRFVRLVIRPGKNDEFKCKLRPTIIPKSGGYVITAQSV